MCAIIKSTRANNWHVSGTSIALLDNDQVSRNCSSVNKTASYLVRTGRAGTSAAVAVDDSGYLSCSEELGLRTSTPNPCSSLKEFSLLSLCHSPLFCTLSMSEIEQLPVAIKFIDFRYIGTTHVWAKMLLKLTLSTFRFEERES